MMIIEQKNCTMEGILMGKFKSMSDVNKYLVPSIGFVFHHDFETSTVGKLSKQQMKKKSNKMNY